MDRVLIGPFDITAVSWRRWAEEPQQWTGNRPLFFSSPHLAPRAQCLVRLAWLIKRLLCRVTRIGRTLEAEISIPSLHEP